MKKILYIILVVFFVFFVSAQEILAYNNYKIASSNAPEAPQIDFNNKTNTCSEILGSNLTKIVKASIKVIQILGAIIAIVNGMIKLIPAIISKDADGLKKASKTLVSMAIILAIIFILPSIVKLIGDIFKFDTTCFF